MLSMPPAMMALYSPARMLLAAIMAALSDEPQTLLMVAHGVETGRPAPKATWRAGFWPAPAWRTWPNKTSSITPEEGSTSARANNSLTVKTPKSTADMEA